MNTLRDYIDIVNTLSEAPVGQPLGGVGGVGKPRVAPKSQQAPSSARAAGQPGRQGNAGDETNALDAIAADRASGALETPPPAPGKPLATGPQNGRGGQRGTQQQPQGTPTIPADPAVPNLGSQGPADDVAAGVRSGGVAPPEPLRIDVTKPVPDPEERLMQQPVAQNQASKDATSARAADEVGGTGAVAQNQASKDMTAARQKGDAARNAQIPGEPDTFQRDTGTGGADPVGTGSVDDPANQEPLATGPQNGRGGRRGSPQTDAELDADSADNAETPAGDSLAGKLNTESPSLMDKYNAGGRKADDDVRNLQTGLSRLGFDPNGIDGKYGNGTFAAVQAFQKAHGLQVDGEAGPETMRKMQELLNGQGAPAATAAAPEQDPEERLMQMPVTQNQASRDITAARAADEVGGTGAVAIDQAAADRARRAGAAQRAGGDPEEKLMQMPVVPEPTVSKEVGVQKADDRDANIADGWNLEQFKSYGTYIDLPNRDGTVTRAYGKEENLQNFIDTDRRGRGLEIQGREEAGVPNAERDGTERGVQTASKEFDMTNFIKEMKDLEECGMMPSGPEKEGNPVTMSVTLNASGEQHVQDLIRMMQLAGAKDAAPVADMHVGPVDKHDDMVHLMKLADEEHGPEEEVEEEWDNAPAEDYKDHKHMTKDLSGGLNREKKAYAKAQPGDNAMAVESIKSQLLKALNDTGYSK